MLREKIRNVAGIAAINFFVPVVRWFFRISGRWDGTQVGTPRSILLVELADIGDMALASATWRQVRCLFPNAHITLVVQPSVLNLVECCPYIDETLTFHYRDYREWKMTRVALVRWWIKGLRFAVAKLWPLELDLAITPRWDADGLQALGALIGFVGGARRIIGFRPDASDLATSKVARANRRLYTEGPVRPPVKHELELRAEILKALGADEPDTTLELWPTRDDAAAADEIIGQKGDTLVALAPGAAWDFRRWPSAYFTQLGRWLQNDYGANILLLGSPADEPLCASIADGLHEDKVVNAAGRITLRHMAALLQRCVLFVGNDSGPLHVATAAQIPVVGLYGPGVYQRFRPWGAMHEMIRLGLPCSPCPESCLFDRPHCMEGITVGMAQASVRRILDAAHKIAPAPPSYTNRA